MKLERDGAHGFGAMQDGGIQEQHGAQKTTRSREGNRGFHQFDIGGRLQAPKDKREERFNGRTDMGSGCRQGMGLEGTPGHEEASDE